MALLIVITVHISGEKTDLCASIGRVDVKTATSDASVSLVPEAVDSCAALTHLTEWISRLSESKICRDSTEWWCVAFPESSPRINEATLLSCVCKSGDACAERAR